ncbi:MAG: methyltransferase domain-containing protein [Ktedonobacteraceae bacterium]
MREEETTAMSSAGIPAAKATTYFADAENAGEMARLLKQARFATKGLGGLFPQHLDVTAVHDVLDLACGPGEWVLSVAEDYPTMRVTGIDQSRVMVQFARSISQAVPMVSFHVMDVLAPLDFPDESFDLIHARFICGFMPTNAWAKLLAECWRLLRPGGILLLVEGEMALTTSPAVERLSSLFTRALCAVGQSFSPDGKQLGITAVLRRLLTEAGFASCRAEAAAMEHSAGTEFHASLYEDYYVAFHLMQPFLVQAAVASYEELIPIYNRMLEEMRADDFCSLTFLLQAWGSKPSV